MIRVLVTGAGGAAAISFIEAVAGQPDLELHAADIDPYAPGLYLVAPSNRAALLPGTGTGFVDHLVATCSTLGVNLLVPTVDAELLPIARRASEFAMAGVQLLMPSVACLERCLDKHRLLQTVATDVPVPSSHLVPAGKAPPPTARYPLFVKPRCGSGSRGIGIAHDARQLATLCRTGDDMLVQEVLPGREYSVDVLCSRTGRVVAAVPRERLKVDSGVAITSRSLHHAELEDLAARVAKAVGLRGVANVQFKEDASGRPRLLEVNPRFPGTMPLTIASGVNMPLLALHDLIGRPIPNRCGFSPRGLTRVFRNVSVAPGDLRRQEQACPAPTTMAS